MNTTLETLLTVSEVAARLRLSHETVYKLIRDGELAASRAGKQKLIIRPVDVMDYLERNLYQPHRSPSAPGDALAPAAVVVTPAIPATDGLVRTLEERARVRKKRARRADKIILDLDRRGLSQPKIAAELTRRGVVNDRGVVEWSQSGVCRRLKKLRSVAGRERKGV